MLKYEKNTWITWLFRKGTTNNENISAKNRLVHVNLLISAQVNDLRVFVTN